MGNESRWIEGCSEKKRCKVQKKGYRWRGGWQIWQNREPMGKERRFLSSYLFLLPASNLPSPFNCSLDKTLKWTLPSNAAFPLFLTCSILFSLWSQQLIYPIPLNSVPDIVTNWTKHNSFLWISLITAVAIAVKIQRHQSRQITDRGYCG